LPILTTADRADGQTVCLCTSTAGANVLFCRTKRRISEALGQG
jgi:hypothetical protein